MYNLKWMGCIGILTLALAMTACSDDNNDTNPTPDTDHHFGTNGGMTSGDGILFSVGPNGNVVFNDNGTQIGTGEQNYVFTGTQTIAKGTYQLKGWVYVADGAVLTIEPGTVIRGDKATRSALIVEPGGQLIAQGTASEPIVFTSGEAVGNRRPGDWGGVIICGRANNNQQDMQIEGGPRTHHGGTNDSDNSGVLSYVRIEFPGYPFQADQEINGLTLGSVGSGTKIDHVQVSFSNDDSFEWFGGAVNCSHLVAYKGWDDDFDTDNGFSGRVQFALAVRHPRIADQSRSNGFESDNCADGTGVTPFTTARFSNVTFIGPKYDATFQNTSDYINAGDYYPNNGSALGRFQAGMQIRRNSRLSCFNSVIVGWPIGIMFDNQRGDTQGAATNGDLQIGNIWMANCDVTGSDANGIYVDSLVTYNGSTAVVDPSNTSFSSRFFLSQGGCQVADLGQLMLQDAHGVGAPFMPMAGSPMLSAASFATAGNDFEAVPYIGAFAAGDNWLEGWTEFDPQNAQY